MREQIRGHCSRTVLVLVLCQRPDERAYVYYERRCFLSVKLFYFRQSRMQAEGISMRVADWQQGISREREIGARRAVLGKPRHVGRDNHVVAVVAAEQKYADQCSVVGRRAGQRAHHAEAVHRGGKSKCRQRGASDFQETAARNDQRTDALIPGRMTRHCCTWYSLAVAPRNSASNARTPGSGVASTAVLIALRTSAGIWPPKNAMSIPSVSAASLAPSSTNGVISTETSGPIWETSVPMTQLARRTAVDDDSSWNSGPAAAPPGIRVNGE